MGVIVLDTETDGDVPGGPFGEITFEDTAEGVVSFEIDLFGQFDSTDIHQFGFFSTYTGPLAIDPTSIGAADFTVTPNTSGVSGLGLQVFDWVVDFDNGQPALEPLEFDLIGDADWSTASLINAPLVDVRGEPISAAVHVQRTSTPAGSETFTGQTGHTGVIPEPASVAIFAMMLVGLILKRVR